MIRRELALLWALFSTDWVLLPLIFWFLLLAIFAPGRFFEDVTPDGQILAATVFAPLSIPARDFFMGRLERRPNIVQYAFSRVIETRTRDAVAFRTDQATVILARFLIARLGRSQMDPFMLRFLSSDTSVLFPENLERGERLERFSQFTDALRREIRDRAAVDGHPWTTVAPLLRPLEEALEGEPCEDRVRRAIVEVSKHVDGYYRGLALRPLKSNLDRYLESRKNRIEIILVSLTVAIAFAALWLR